MGSKICFGQSDPCCHRERLRHHGWETENRKATELCLIPLMGIRMSPRYGVVQLTPGHCEVLQRVLKDHTYLANATIHHWGKCYAPLTNGSSYTCWTGHPPTQMAHVTWHRVPNRVLWVCDVHLVQSPCLKIFTQWDPAKICISGHV